MPTSDPQRIRRLEHNLWLLCGFRVLQMTMLPVAIAPLYWRDQLGLDMVDIFAVHAIFGLFAACLEFPGGYIADRIGYRASMRIATVASMIGWIALGLATGFWTVLAGEFLLAISLEDCRPAMRRSLLRLTGLRGPKSAPNPAAKRQSPPASVTSL